jgi:hypothetical protein
MQTDHAWVRSDWQVADNVVAGTTTRYGGYSTAPALAENNLGLNVGDVPRLVQRNRQGLARFIEDKATVNATVKATLKSLNPSTCNGWIRFTAAIVSMLDSTRIEPLRPRPTPCGQINVGWP